jgi:uncharacterized protein
VITRRTFLRYTRNATIAAGGVGLYAWRVEPEWLEVVRRPLPIAHLPPTLTGCTLLQLSDVHAGDVDDEYLIESFQELAALRPDIVVMTGDFVSYHRDVFEQLSRVYAHFPNGRLATLAVLGNHDYGPRWSRPDVALQIVDRLKPRGIRVLRNEIADVEGLQIGGLDDYWGRQFDATRVIPRLLPDRAALVLSHNPDTVDLHGWDGYRGWILSGHTHGGQCRPPFLPPPILPVQNKRYTSGEFELSGGRTLYISRGIGNIMRVRFNVRPEATLFELRPARS